MRWYSAAMRSKMRSASAWSSTRSAYRRAMVRSALARIIWALSISVRQNGQRWYMACSSGQVVGVLGQVLGDRAAQAVPAGQRVPALHPAEDPGDGPQLVDAGRPRRAAAAASAILSCDISAIGVACSK